MSNVVKFPNQEKRLDAASLWIARLDRSLSKQEELELSQWLAEDPENQQTLLRLAKLWDKMDRLSLLSELFPVQKTSKNYSFRYAIAASLVFLCVSLGFYLNSSAPANSVTSPFIAYTTVVGEQRKIFLEDGSTLILNTDSLVQVSFTTKQRLLVLNRGEIHIDVAHDVERPLRVIALDKMVQAVGTAFDVRLLDTKNVKLWVTEGKVVVGDNRNSRNAEVLEKVQHASNSFSISKGEKVLLSGTSKQVESISDGDMKAQLGWQQGNIVFHGETLEEAVLEFNRYSDKVFVIKDASLKKIRIAGMFKIGDTHSLLQTLKSNFDIRYDFERENKIYLTMDAK